MEHNSMNVQTLILTGYIGIHETSEGDLKPYMDADGIRFWLKGGFSLRIGDYVQAIGKLRFMVDNMVIVDCHVTILQIAELTAFDSE